MRDVVAAFVAALESEGLNVHKGLAPKDASKPYVVVNVPRPRLSDRSMAAKHAAASWRIPTMYVGTSLDSVIWVAEKVEAALKDQRLSVTGKACSPMMPESGRPAAAELDDNTVYSATDAWVFRTSTVPIPPPPPPPPPPPADDEDEDPPA